MKESNVYFMKFNVIFCFCCQSCYSVGAVFFYSESLYQTLDSEIMASKWKQCTRKWYKMNVDILIHNLNSIRYRYVDCVVAIVLSLFFHFLLRIESNRMESNGMELCDKNLRTLTDNRKSHVKRYDRYEHYYWEVIGR